MTFKSGSIPALVCVLAAGGVLAAQEVQSEAVQSAAVHPAETRALTPAPTAPAPEVNEYTDGSATSTSAASVNTAGVSQVRIVRLSQVMGKVQMDRNTRAGFEPTFANLPIVQGAKLKTLEGVAEVEFEDNSSLRIAPDSLLEISRLGRDTAGTTSNGFNLAQGTMYLSLAPTKGNEFVIRSGDETFTVAPASHVRLDVYPAGSELKVFKGAVDVKDSTGSYQLAKGKVFQFGGQSATTPKIAKNDEPGLYDKWDKQSVDYHEVAINSQSYAGNGFQYGMNDLNYYGAFSNVAGCGNVWQPYFTSANWNPYGSGMWAYYPGAGYSFVSPYPWGWMPYHSGNWVSCGGAGWGWQPGGNFNGLNNVASNGFTGGGVVLKKPGTTHTPGIVQPTLIPVGISNLRRSELNPSQKFQFAKDSAGFGVPRSAFGNLNKMSQQVAVRGTAESHFNATALSIPARTTSIGNNAAGNGPLNSMHTVSSVSHSSAPMSRPVAAASTSNASSYSGSGSSSMHGGPVGGSSSAPASHMSSAPSASSSSGGGSHK